MKNNISSIIDGHYQEIEKRISKLGWNRDGNTFTSVNGLSLQFNTPTILCHDRGQEGSGRYIWYRLSIGDDKHSEMVLKHALKKVLDIIDLSPFIDEDAGGKFFVEKHENFPSYVEVYCYINPDFPDGYWQNHALPEGHK